MAEFFDTYWVLLYNFASKAGLEQSDAEDVVADTVFIVSKAIGEFDYDRKKGKFR
ncbi:MAG: sigma-70 family RNA polymerase sigma factor, partial [Pedosphaera sp.]|nr:sigma-70 family RNA polymerase sigma factor [Pedosphaera sp.]